MRSSAKENFRARGRRTGRPPLQLPDLKVVEELAQRGLSFDQIATSLGLSHATFFRRKKESKEFCDAVRRGRAKGTVSASNALLELVKANNPTATIRLLKQLGWNKRDNRSCPGPWYVVEIRQKRERKHFRSLIQFMTTEERNRCNELMVRLAEGKKAGRGGGHTDVGDSQENLKVPDNGYRFRDGSKPSRGRTGRPRWVPPELSVVTDLAERGLTHDELAFCLEIDPATLFRKIRSDQDFAQAIATGRARAMAFAAGKLFEQALNGKMRAVKFYLKSKAGWGEDYPEHEHGRGCIPAEERERTMAELSLLTLTEKIEYLDIVKEAEERMKAAGIRDSEDGLDEWGNVIKRPE